METTSFLRRRLQVSLDLIQVFIPVFLAYVALSTGLVGLGVGWELWLPWVGVVLVTGGAWWATALAFRRSEAPGTTHVGLSIMAAWAAVLALEYSWFLVTAFPRLDAVGQIYLAAGSAALACLGASALAIRPWTAGTWVGGIGLGAGAVVLGDPRWPEPLTLAVIAGLFTLLGFVVAGFHRMFLARLRAEVLAHGQQQLVELLLHEFEEGAQDWLWETDEEGRLRGVSTRLAGLFNRDPGDVEGRRLVDMLGSDPAGLTVEDEEDLAALASHLASGRAFRDLEVPVQFPGHYRRWRLTAKPIVGADGGFEGWRGVGSDVTEVQRLHNLNARMALLDTLTGLANRHRLQTVLHDHLTPREDGRPCALVLLDLQNFRMVNESLGHEVGDNLLRDVALRLRSRVPASALLARLGGDEFALVASSVTDEALEGLVSALRATAEDPFMVDGIRLEVSYRIGIARAPEDGHTAADLLRAAALALHEAKARNEDVPVAYEARFGQRAQDRMRLQGELKLALIQDEFELHYQPQIRAADGVLVGAEALVRWRHPVRGMVSPAEFIPVLEETGLIVPVGIWILEAACRQALTWAGSPKVAVNVSAVQFASRTFLDSVEGVLAATGFPPQRLELEITESVMAQDPKQVIQSLQTLRARGISIALDDFGTGYSSLSYLRSLPLDKLKVDQAFVRVLEQDPNAEAIVGLVLELSRVLHLETTAEGVETPAQRDRLAAMGVDNFQGYLFSKPLPAEAFTAFQASGPARS